MSTKSSGRLKIPQWAIVSRVVTANSIFRDEHDVEIDRERTDITLGIVHFTARDADGNIVIQKSSADPLEILILDQLVAATMGQARVYFVEADTAALTVGAEYWFDCWVALNGVEEPIVDRGKFLVCKSVTHISAGVAPSLPTVPASQTPQERTFSWVAPSTGSDFDITIPGTGMVDENYHVGSSLVGLPALGNAAICLFETALKSSTQFNMQTSGVILIGTAFTFHIRGL